MRVKTDRRCFVDNMLRESGDIFDYSGKLADWMTPVDQDGNPIQADEGKPKRKPKTQDREVSETASAE